MDYLKVYTQLIDAAKSKHRSKKTGYYECHHILPRCMGGTDHKENLVLLTPREHFIAHYLLYKNNPIRKLRDSILMFKGKDSQYYNSRLYEVVRIEHIIEMKQNNPSLYLDDDTKKRKSDKLKAYIKTPEHCENISKAKKGKPGSRTGASLSKEQLEKTRKSLIEWYQNNEVSTETRLKISIANTGNTHTLDSINKMKASASQRIKFMCPVCNKTNLDGGNFNQHMRGNHNWNSEQCQSFKAAPDHTGNHGLIEKAFSDHA